MPSSLATWGRQLYFQQKEVVLWIFIAPKNSSSSGPVLNPRTLGPVESTLSDRPPRATGYFLRNQVVRMGSERN
jgi:hypothetical protein